MLGVSSLGLPHGSLDDFLTLALEYDARLVELRVADGEAVHLGLSPQERATARRKLEQAGVRVLALDSYLKVCGEEPVDLAAHLRLAADLGAAGVRVFPSGPAPGAGTETAGRRIEEAAPLAEELGVRILVETHDSHPRGADVAALLAAVEGAPVGAIWDAAHPWVAGEEPGQTQAALASYLSHVQVKDVLDRIPGAIPALPGHGVLPLREVVAAVPAGTPLVLEWEKPWHPVIAGLRVALAATSRWLDAAAA